MDYYGNNDWRDYLAHYGVKGMKWRKHKYLSNVNGDYQYSSVFNGIGDMSNALRKGARSRLNSTKRALRYAAFKGQLRRFGNSVYNRVTGRKGASVGNSVGNASNMVGKDVRAKVKSTRRATRLASIKGRLLKTGATLQDQIGKRYLKKAVKRRKAGDVDGYYENIRKYNNTASGKRRSKRTGHEVSEIREGATRKVVSARRNLKEGVGNKGIALKRNVANAVINSGVKSKSRQKPLKRKKTVTSGGSGVKRTRRKS